MAGICTLIICEFVFLVYPQWYPLAYVATMIPLVLIRYFSYRKCKYHWFCLDLCYFINFLLVVLIVLLRHNVVLFQVCFAYAVGPLTFAIQLWQNALVFHDLDKLTSLFLHIQPSLVMFCLRWRLPNDLPDTFFLQSYVFAFITYFLWQTLYLVATEILSKSLKEDDMLMTSLRWIRKSSRSGSVLHFFFSRVPDSLHWLLFALLQVLYTFATMIPARLVYQYRSMHVVFIVLSILSSAYNGATFYTMKYYKKAR
ncbi:hypothetical protein GEMRC1_004678 [Eukaryota sp. GEM-RC1]